jgi:hypothetical protein
LVPNPYEAVLALAERKQWQDAVELGRQAGAEALAQKNFVLARNIGTLLGRLNDHQVSARLLASAFRGLQPPSPLPEWDGSSLADRALLVMSRNMHVGPVIRYGRLLSVVAPRAKRCIALVEARLLSLFRRSVPHVDVWEAGQADAEAYAQADVMASYETLTQHVGVNESGGLVALPALKADAVQVSAFRTKYGRGVPLIGICWHSTNQAKDLPALDIWARFLSRLDATFVSIQYGDAEKDVETLRRLSGATIINDETVDSLADLDGFAAQVAALDAVVTISNTGAHMTGSLGVPLFVLLDDKDHLLWPLSRTSSDWYPSAKLYRKAARPWSEVFAEIEADLTEQLDLKPSAS